jgi:3-oxoacyl-[acyl-carrier protein] reductase
MTKRALITGGLTGIGLAIANEFRNNGIEVITPTIEELNLISRNSIRKYAEKLNAPIDILVNNAGINPIEDFIKLTEIEIEETLKINFTGPFTLTQFIIPKMIENSYGRIINISSIWSIVSKQKRSIYSSTKAAMNSFTRTLAIELAQYNILVNAVAPGFVNTELTKKNNSESEIKKIAENIPIKRFAEPYEIANIVYFLCSEKNSFITGQTIIADGGFTCL